MTPKLLPFSFLLLLLLHTTTTTTTTTTSSSSHTDPVKNSTEFIRTSCTSTLYPSLCFNSLSRYANAVHQNPVHLAWLAANLTLSRVRSLNSYVSALSSSSPSALRDCVDCLGDAVEQVEKSRAEIGRLDAAVGEEVAWRVANVQTWMSAALTNEDTCSDGFVKGGHVKDDVYGRVRRAKEFTSNALALVNRLVASR